MDERNYDVIVTVQCFTYNHELYIRQCLDGLLMQSTDFKYEIVVHDDASTDKTTDVIKEYAMKYPHIIIPIYEKENIFSKHDGSINKIVNNKSRGKYIAMCDGDDYWIDPRKLQKQVDFMESHQDYSLCGTNGLLLWDGYVKQPKYFSNLVQNCELGPEQIIGHWCFPTASLLFRRELLDLYPSWFSEIISYDMLTILISLYYGKIYAFKDITCVYRQIVGGSILSKSVHSKKNYLRNNLIKLYKLYSEYSDHKFDVFINPYVKSLESTSKWKDVFLLFLVSLAKKIVGKWIERTKFQCVIN